MPADQQSWAVGDQIKAVRLNRLNRLGVLVDVTATETGPTLPTAAVNVAPANTFAVITLTEQRRVHVDALVNVQAASAAGRYAIRIGYNSGAAAGTPTVLGKEVNLNVPAGQPGSGWCHASVLLAAGTWRIYPLIARYSGGSTSDNITGTNGIEISDVGAS